MYVTRPLSLYYNSPNAVTDPPPEGPNAGILVIEDVEAEEQVTCCWGTCKNNRISKGPFPQNRRIRVEHTSGTSNRRSTDTNNIYFVPVINQPLSSNRYYAITEDGKYKGNVCRCSKEEDATTCCLGTSAKDVKPSPFDHGDIYQQFEIIRHGYGFYAKSVAPDGIPPYFLKRRWDAYTSEPSHYILGKAEGLNTTLRSRMPDINFPISRKHSPGVVVGKWYCPYIFIREGNQSIKEQMRMSMFYEMTLVQFWQEIYASENYNGEGKVVEVSVSVKREVAFLNGTDDAGEKFEIVDGLVWFKPANFIGNGLGLSSLIWERMRWEEARGGWVDGEKVGRVERAEAYDRHSGWKKFGCYVLVERFVLKRMDGSLALTYDFKHTSKIQIKWE